MLGEEGDWEEEGMAGMVFKQGGDNRENRCQEAQEGEEGAIYSPQTLKDWVNPSDYLGKGVEKPSS